MSEPAPNTRILRTPEELRALRSPLAFRILATLQRIGPASARELAEFVGRPAESLYYHLHRLVQVGILDREAGAAGRPGAAVYRPRGEVAVDRNCRTPAFLAALAAVYRTALRTAERQLEQALGLEAAASGPRSATDVRQWTVRLDDAALERVHEVLGQLTDILVERVGATDGHAFSVTTVLARLEGAAD